jgi:hypothetical protein
MEIAILILCVVNTVALVVLLARTKPREPKPKRAPKPALDALVREAFDVGERMGEVNKSNGNKVTGRDKRQVAMRYITQRLEAAAVPVDYPDLLQRIEAEVQRRKEPKP